MARKKKTDKKSTGYKGGEVRVIKSLEYNKTEAQQVIDFLKASYGIE